MNILRGLVQPDLVAAGQHQDMPRSASRAASPRPNPDDAPVTTAHRS